MHQFQLWLQLWEEYSRMNIDFPAEFSMSEFLYRTICENLHYFFISAVIKCSHLIIYRNCIIAQPSILHNIITPNKTLRERSLPTIWTTCVHCCKYSSATAISNATRKPIGMWSNLPFLALFLLVDSRIPGVSNEVALGTPDYWASLQCDRQQHMSWPTFLVLHKSCFYWLTNNWRTLLYCVCKTCCWR